MELKVGVVERKEDWVEDVAETERKGKRVGVDSFMRCYILILWVIRGLVLELSGQ